VQSFTYRQLIKAMDDYIIRAQIVFPDSVGAMDFNQSAYCHVSFQMGLSALANYAIAVEQIDVFEMVVKAIEYSYHFQTEEGDFQLIMSTNLSNGDTLTDDELSSGTSFFLSALGSALLLFQESEWLAANQHALAYRSRIESLQTAFQRSLQYLKSKRHELLNYESDSASRLLLHAWSFYSMGKYLNDREAMNIGRNFAEAAIAKQHPKGFFLEKRGYDTSFQGTALENGFKLFLFLPENDSLKQRLWESLSCGTNWLRSRILATGEIASRTNTWVNTLGMNWQEASTQVNWQSVVNSLLFMHYHTLNQKYYHSAKKVFQFYTSRKYG
jgi:hypothetical protein